jgi:hypothetical protein
MRHSADVFGDAWIACFLTYVFNFVGSAVTDSIHINISTRNINNNNWTIKYTVRVFPYLHFQFEWIVFVSLQSWRLTVCC